MRLDVDLERAARVTGHDEFQHSFATAAVRRRVPADPKEARFAVRQRAQRLLDHDRLDAAAADPSLDRSVGQDEAVRAGPRRGWTADGDDRGNGERPTDRL